MFSDSTIDASQDNVQHTLKSALMSIQVFGVLYGASYLVYNHFFHPLRRFPGPRLWALSRIPWCYHQYCGQLHIQLLRLHVQYGHTVRVAPTELSYTDPNAWNDIYSHRKDEMPKDPIFRLHTPTGAQNILVADRQTHTRQRRLLSHAFSESALREQEPILQLYAKKLLDRLSVQSKRGPVDMVAWLTFASFDLIGHMSFGENFGCLDAGTYAPFVRSITDMASELTVTQMAKYWGLDGIRQFLMPKGQRRKHIGTAMETVSRRITNGSEHRDFLHYILRANDDKGMSPQEIHVNAFSLSIAGSESTATALSGILFLILSHPPVYMRLVSEIRAAHASEEDVTLASTHGLTYMDAVINEALRIYPPVAITLPRIVPYGGAEIAGAFVPAGTTVGVNHYSTYHSPSNFEDPERFAPERWLDDSKSLLSNGEALRPFSHGPRSCLGKNIARAEMRLLLAKLLVRFDWTLEEEREGWIENQRVRGFWVKGSLWCRLAERVT
ncbi:monooxygenase [Ophiobolus disseminans]|uniref:Monooxygenase n=1 Tax=Ophiobolus disseminans TaxID=1469910 RepID=A0A6A7A396_9PLEO|nr:monooxygenase [Ophiobolus disseminans]